MPDSPPDDSHRASLLRRPGCWVTFAAVLPLVIGAAWVVEDRAGRRFLAQTKARLAAEGFQFAPEHPLSAPVPDEENFCATPLLKAITIGDETDPNVQSLRAVADWSHPDRAAISKLMAAARGKRVVARTTVHHLSPHRVPTMADWESLYQSCALVDPATFPLPLPDNPARFLQERLEDRAGLLFHELAQALARPHAVWPEGEGTAAQPWHARTLPRDLVTVLQTRLLLALSLGETAQAETTLRVLARLWGSSDGLAFAQDRPAYLRVRDTTIFDIRLMAWLRQLPAAAWRDIGEAVGRDRALRHFQASFMKQVTETSGETKTILKNRPADVFQHWFVPRKITLPPSADKLGGVMDLLPQGWYDFNEAHYLAFNWEFVQAMENAAKPHYSLEYVWKESPLGKPSPSGHLVLSKLMIPSAGHYTVQQAMAQEIVRKFVLLVCALEAHFQDHGDYPDDLDALLPAVQSATLNDLDGRPLRYRRESHNGRYTLWSVGLDGIDDGGLASDPVWPSHWRPTDKDLIWGYP